MNLISWFFASANPRSQKELAIGEGDVDEEWDSNKVFQNDFHIHILISCAFNLESSTEPR